MGRPRTRLTNWEKLIAFTMRIMAPARLNSQATITTLFHPPNRKAVTEAFLTLLRTRNLHHDDRWPNEYLNRKTDVVKVLAVHANIQTLGYRGVTNRHLTFFGRKLRP